MNVAIEFSDTDLFIVELIISCCLLLITFGLYMRLLMRVLSLVICFEIIKYWISIRSNKYVTRIVIITLRTSPSSSKSTADGIQHLWKMVNSHAHRPSTLFFLSSNNRRSDRPRFPSSTISFVLPSINLSVRQHSFIASSFTRSTSNQHWVNKSPARWRILMNYLASLSVSVCAILSTKGEWFILGHFKYVYLTHWHATISS